MKRISIIAFSVIILCFSVFSASAVDYKCSEETVSNAVYLENLNSGAVVYEKNSDQQSYPASTTKIMTFVITAENVSDLDQTTVTIKQDVISRKAASKDNFFMESSFLKKRFFLL